MSVDELNERLEVLIERYREDQGKIMYLQCVVDNYNDDHLTTHEIEAILDTMERVN